MFMNESCPGPYCAAQQPLSSTTYDISSSIGLDRCVAVLCVLAGTIPVAMLHNFVQPPHNSGYPWVPSNSLPPSGAWQGLASTATADDGALWAMQVLWHHLRITARHQSLGVARQVSLDLGWLRPPGPSTTKRYSDLESGRPTTDRVTAATSD